MAFIINADRVFSDSLLSTLDEFRKSGICVDTQLISGSDSDSDKNYLWCHRCVIAAASPFFRGLFTNDMRERTDSTATIHGMSMRTLQLLLDFIYTGTAVPSSDYECIALLTAGGFLVMDDLIAACAKVLGKSVTVNNCLLIEAAADASNCTWLLNLSRNFALANFEAVCNTSSFLELDYQRLIWYMKNYAESVMGIGSDHVLDGCDTVYRALGKWTRHQESNFSSDNKTVANHSQTCAACSSGDTCFCSSANNPSALDETQTVQNLFAQLLSFSIIDASLNNENTTAVPITNTNKSSSQQVGVMIVTCGRSQRVWAFSQKRNSWLSLPSLPNAVSKAGLTALGGSLYIVGGCVDGIPTDAAWRLDVLPASWHLIRQPADSRPVAKWTPIKPMPCPRADHAIAAIGNRYITIIGGYGPNGPVDPIICYDRASDSWLECGRCASVPRIGARLAVIANYSSSSESGRRRDSSTSSIVSEKVLNQPQTNTWTLLEVGGLQAGGQLSVIDCYSVVCKSYPKQSSMVSSSGLVNVNANSTPTEPGSSEMHDEVLISFSGEQLLLPQPVRYAEPVVLCDYSSNYASSGSDRVLVVCSDFSNQFGVSPNPYCFILSFDLTRRLCRVVSSDLPGETRVQPAVSRSSDGSSIFVVGGLVYSSSSPLFENDATDNNNPAPSNNFKPVKTVEMFKEETREWTRMADIPEAQSEYCSSLLLFNSS